MASTRTHNQMQKTPERQTRRIIAFMCAVAAGASLTIMTSSKNEVEESRSVQLAEKSNICMGTACYFATGNSDNATTHIRSSIIKQSEITAKESIREQDCLQKEFMDEELRIQHSSGPYVGRHYNLSFWLSQLEKSEFDRFETTEMMEQVAGEENRMIVQESEKGKPFLFCTIAKVGCSRWRQLLLKANGAEDWSRYIHDLEHRFQTVQAMKWHQRLEVLQNARRMRVLVVRNPFSRLLSAYLDKVDKFELPKTFAAFVIKVVNGKTMKSLTDNHWRAQSTFCGAQSLQFDFIGRLEDVDKWGDALLKRTGLYNASLTGFGKFGNDTYWGAQVGSRPTGAVDKLVNYYTPELVEIVMKNYKEDIVRFGYMDDYLELREAVASSVLNEK